MKPYVFLKAEWLLHSALDRDKEEKLTVGGDKDGTYDSSLSGCPLFSLICLPLNVDASVLFYVIYVYTLLKK